MPLNDPIGSTALDALQRNVQDTDRFVNQTSGTVTTRLGEILTPLPVANSQIAADVAAVDASRVSAQSSISANQSVVSSSAATALSNIAADTLSVQTAADEAMLLKYQLR